MKHWYAVYTKSGQEKKIASVLTRKGIQNYYPLNSITAKKLVREPLFDSYVFVNITEAELSTVKKISGIVNIVYWMAKPAIIQNDEIAALQQFTSTYSNIKLERSAVSTTERLSVADDPIISFNENAAKIRFQVLKIKLPSLGYTMIAERDEKVNDAPAITHPRTFNKQLDSFLSN